MKKDDVIRIPIYAIHHSDNFHNNPDCFEPERFLGKPQHHNFAFLPFGSGPRACLARNLALMEAKFALLHIIRCYRLSVCEQTKVSRNLFPQKKFYSPISNRFHWSFSARETC